VTCRGSGLGGNGRLVTVVTAAVVCLPGLAACGSAGTVSPSGTVVTLPTAGKMGGYHVPLLRCTKAQQAAAAGPVRTIRVNSSQTVHATVGEHVELVEGIVDMRPEASQVEVRAGQKNICQSSDIQGKLPSQVLPLVINGPGRAEVAVNTPSSLPGPETLTIFYIDSTKAS
jgi:hypothetical protein